MIAMTNRIAALLEQEPAAQHPSRSPARAAASRRNRSKSGGPVTPEGKAKSARNATRHGLLSLRFTPPADGRGDDRLFRHFRRELLAEFQPRGFLDRLTIDHLAHDLVQLARCRAMVEALHRPAGIPVADGEAHDKLRSAHRDLKAVRCALDALDAGQQLRAQPKAAHLAADAVARAIQGLDGYVNQPYGLSRDEMDVYERQEFDETNVKWLAVRPARKLLLDRSRVATILQGTVCPTSAQRRHLRAALGIAADNLATFVRRLEQGRVEQRVKQRHDAALLALAENPNALMLLQRYQVRIERSIERKVAQLRAG